MRFRQIKSLLGKELRCFLRDRQTLVILGLPVLFWPFVLLIGSQVFTILKKAGETKNKPATVSEKHVRVTPFNIPADASLLNRLKSERNIKFVSSQKPLEDLKNQGTDLVFEMSSDAGNILRQNKQAALTVHYDGSRSYDTNIWNQVRSVVGAYTKDILRSRLRDESLTDAYLAPLNFQYAVTESKKSPTEKVKNQTRAGLSLLFLIGVLVALSWNFSLFLEEKEGGTLETILSGPISGAELLTAKSLTFLLITTLQMILYAASAWGTSMWVLLAWKKSLGFTMTFHHGPLLCLCLFQFAIFITVSMLLICSLTKSFKAASNLVGLFTAGIMLLCLPAVIPEFAANGLAFCVPGLNSALIVRELSSGTFHSARFLAAFLSSLFHSSFCFFLACKLFGREEMLFGRASAFHLSFRPSNIAVKSFPTPSEALFFCFVAMVFLLYAGVPLQLRDMGTGFIQTLLIVFFALPIIFAAYRKCDFRKTFRLYLPSLKTVLSGIMLIGIGLFLLLRKTSVSQNNEKVASER